MTTSSTEAAGAKPVFSGFTVSERAAHLRAETALFMRDHVLSLVSHDLRGPLNAIHSWAYVLERKLDANDPNSQRAVTGIRSGVDQQVKLLETIIDATRAGTKSLALANATFPLHPLLDETVAEVRSGLARVRGVEVAVESQLATEQASESCVTPGRRGVGDAHICRRGEHGGRGGHAGRTRGRHPVVRHRHLQAERRSTGRSCAASFAGSLCPQAGTRTARGQTDRLGVRAVQAHQEAHGGSFEQSDILESETATLALHVPLSAPTAA